MRSKTVVSRRRGRPVSGKKGFMVRMPPDAYEAIKHIAEDNGLSVGDWMAKLHITDYPPGGLVDEDEPLAVHHQRENFIVLATETSRLLEMLYEFADCDPRVVDDDSVARTLSTFEAKRKRLMAFLKRECPERYRNY